MPLPGGQGFSEIAFGAGVERFFRFLALSLLNSWNAFRKLFYMTLGAHNYCTCIVCVVTKQTRGPCKPVGTTQKVHLCIQCRGSQQSFFQLSQEM